MSEEKEEKVLMMSFDPHTIEHLGVKMYSQLPNAIAELVANSYDAESPDVHIKLTDTATEKSIAVIDKGVGMSFEEINSNFLMIGRRRRDTDMGMSPNKIRKVTGRKGLGKLAFFGIGDTIQIVTKKNGECVDFSLSWNDIINSHAPVYKPNFHRNPCEESDTGTTIILTNLKRKTAFNPETLAISLSRLFNFFDEKFTGYISLNDNPPIKIDNKLKYSSIAAQFTWNIPSFKKTELPYFDNKSIKGELLATEKPLTPGLRGITLYAHGRMVNAPEFFGVGESSHFYSYLTGWLDVDFIDEQDEDIISTDRQSLSWDLPLTTELQANLKQLLSLTERDWRAKRKSTRERKIKEQTRIDFSTWFPTLSPQIKIDVEKIVNSVIENSEMGNDKQSELVGSLYTLVPAYAQYHWRRLHSSVQDASYEDYKREDFYRAVEEVIKRYESITQSKSGQTALTGQGLITQVFGKDKPLSVSDKYKKRDGSDFSNTTTENIEEGQKFLSMGVFAGVRNPLAHEEKVELKETGLFTENDCLDMLSLLSHLFRRLDDAIKK